MVAGILTLAGVSAGGVMFMLGTSTPKEAEPSDLAVPAAPEVSVPTPGTKADRPLPLSPPSVVSPLPGEPAHDPVETAAPTLSNPDHAASAPSRKKITDTRSIPDGSGGESRSRTRTVHAASISRHEKNEIALSELLDDIKAAERRIRKNCEKAEETVPSGVSLLLEDLRARANRAEDAKARTDVRRQVAELERTTCKPSP